jgi:biopolymer transport protein ExbD
MGKQFICLEALSVSALRFQLVSKINLLPLVLDVCLLIFVIFHASAIWADFNLHLFLKSY